MSLLDNRLSNLVHWLIYELPYIYLRLAVNVPRLLAEAFSLKMHVRYLFTPMFHDTTATGRFLSLFARLAILTSGLIIWSVVFILAWLVFPLLLVLPVFSLFGYPNLLILIWLILIFLIFLWRLTVNAPWGRLKKNYRPDEVARSLPPNLGSLVSSYPTNYRSWWTNDDIKLWTARLGVDVNYLLNQVDGWDQSVNQGQLLEAIHQTAMQADTFYPEIGEVMLALMQVDSNFNKVLTDLEIEPDLVKEVAKWMRREIEWFRKYPTWDERYRIFEDAGFNLAMTGTPTPVLNSFSFDLTMHAQSLPRSVDREEELSELLTILSQKNRQHVMIIGESGSGKTTFVGGLAQAIMRGSAPEQIANHRVVKLEPGRLVAGVHNQGELADRLLASLEEIKRSEDIILFIDEIHTLLTAEENTSGLNMFSLIEEALSEGEIQIIGTTTQTNYKKYIEPNEAFARLFAIVRLEEPDDHQAMIMLQNVSAYLEMQHRVIISLPAIQTAIKLSRRYVHNEVLPDKGKNLLDQACMTKKMSGEVVDPEDVARVIARLTGVPITAVGEEEKSKLMQLEKVLHEKFIDQDLAVSTIADALRRGRLDVREQKKPIGSFMFVGPTGVGKTELARRLAEVYFGSESAVIRLDMSEFSNANMIQRLTGAAPGEPGFGQGGELTERIRRQPAALIVLDEIEKAHAKVWDLLLQVFDEGRLTDSAGLTVDFTNSIIICTSNAVTHYITDQIAVGKQLTDLQRPIFDQLLQTFRIEFLNRFDGIVPFGSLSEADMVKVVRIQLQKLSDRLAEKKVIVRYTEELLHQLAVRGTDSRLGARPLRRLIQDKIESHLARVLLEREGDKQMKVDLDEGVLT